MDATNKIGRQALTLVELLVVLAILGIIIALLVCAVQRVRETANIAQSKNNLRQINIATQGFAATKSGAFPKLGIGRNRKINGAWAPGLPGPSLYVQIMPYLEATVPLRGAKGKFRPIAILISPSDPGAAGAFAAGAAITSYAANGEVFIEGPRLANTITDGTSNTIAFAEHYAFGCNGASFPYWQNEPGRLEHRPSFADIGDVRPVTVGEPPVSGPSRRPGAPVLTFQVAPSTHLCSSFVAQTPHSSGMIVAMADGSVRQIAPSISTAVYWGAVTANKGETLPGDW